MSRRPILVTGAIRSGTTWVGRVLAKAPGVALIHEPFNLDHPPGVLAHRWAHQYAYPAEESEERERVERAMTDTLSFRYRSLYHLRCYEGPLRTMGLVRDMPRFWLRRFVTRPRPLLKDPIAVFSAEWLAEQFDMDVLIMVRHPGGFAWSYVRTREPNRFEDLLAQPALMEGPLAQFRDDVAKAAREDDPILEAATLWRLVYGVVADCRRRHPEWTVKRHEDLAVDPFGEFPDLFQHFGLEYTAKARRFLQVTTSPLNPVEALPGVRHHLRRNSLEAVSVWQRRLGADDVRRLRSLTEDLAYRYYLPATWPETGRRATSDSSWYSSK